MDKGMIKIDDLFRQRLSGGEEEERSGAWLRMRELLDEEMPTNAGVNWRRIFGYFAGMLLLASIGIGGYEFTSASRGEHVAIAGTDAAKVDRTPTSSVLKNVSIDAVHANSGKTSMKTDKALASSITSVASSGGNNNYNAPKGNIPAGAVAIAATSKDKYTGAIKNDMHSNLTKNDEVAHSDAVSSHSKKDGEPNARTNDHLAHIQAAKNKNAFATSAAEHAMLTKANGITTKSSLISNTERKIKANSETNNTIQDKLAKTAGAGILINNKTRKHLNKVAANTFASNNSTKSVKKSAGKLRSHSAAKFKNEFASNSSNAAKLPTKRGNKFLVQKDSINKLVITQHYVYDPYTHQGYYALDTVSKVKIPTYAYETIDDANNSSDHLNKMANTEGETASNNDGSSADQKPVPGSSSDNAKNDVNNLASKRRGHGGIHWDWQAVSQKIRDFEYNLGQVKVYPGLIAGVNSTFFGTTSGGGFHFGATGEFVFDDHWSMLAQLRYMQRFNSGVLNNDYVSYSAIDSSYSATNGWNYTIQPDSMQHYFNYSTLHSIEMPIALRYRKGNFYIYGGGNLVYNFAVNTEEIDHSYKKPTHSENFNGKNWQSVLKDGSRYSINDFSSRFGLGYVFGASYEFTPSIMVDLNVTQTFWDNAKTDGAIQISNSLYKSPSMQLSIIYRLNHKKSDIADQ